MIINLRHLCAANCATSKEEPRYYLNGVHVQVVSGNVICVATDGVVLIACQTKGADASWPSEGVIVPSSLIKTLKADDTADIAFAKGMVTIQHDSMKVAQAAIDGSYPNWRRLLPQTLNGEVAQFAVAKLVALSKAAKILNPYAGGISIGHNGGGPALVRLGEDGEAFGILMPIRSAHPDKIPQWAFDHENVIGECADSLRFEGAMSGTKQTPSA